MASPRIFICYILIRVRTGYEGSAISPVFLSPIGWGMCKQLEGQASTARALIHDACMQCRWTWGMSYAALRSGRVDELCRSIVTYLNRVACEGCNGMMDGGWLGGEERWERIIM